MHPHILQYDNRITQTVQSHGAVYGNPRAVIGIFPRMAQGTHASAETPTHVLRERQIMRQQMEQMLMRRIVPATPKADAPRHQVKIGVGVKFRFVPSSRAQREEDRRGRCYRRCGISRAL